MKFDDEPLKDEHLWQYVINQDTYIVQEFGIGIVGIGALLWAYGSVTSDLHETIAWIGLGGSMVLWMHIFGARKEFSEGVKELRKNNKTFFERFDRVKSWRKVGIYRVLYQPVTRLMAYFMGLVSWAWFTIIIRLHNIMPLEMLNNLNIIVLIFAIVLVFIRRHKT